MALSVKNNKAQRPSGAVLAGSAIRSLRERLNIDLADLALAVGMPADKLLAIEAGEPGLCLDDLDRFSEAMAVAPAVFFSSDDKSEEKPQP